VEEPPPASNPVDVPKSEPPLDPEEGVVAPKREKPPPVAPAPVLAGAPKRDVEPLAGVLVVPNKPPPAEGVAVEEEVPKDDPNEKLPRPLIPQQFERNQQHIQNFQGTRLRRTWRW
jgi:hypothetical protein